MAGVRGLAALGRLVAGGPADADAVLLARFAETRDEAAFAALVKRHGPLVAAVCRRHLRQPADVDDAVQATFLVLARKAGSVHTAVGPWLYRVAERTAAKLRRSVRHTEPLPDVPTRPGGLPPDVRAVVADELARLPENYRLVVELCYVAGHSTAEAAVRLGWPKGTVLTRLAWARKRLRANLSRRGVTLGGSLAAALADRPAGGVGPQVARLCAGGEVAGRVLSLCEGVIRAMTLTKLGWAAGLAAAAVAVTGTAVGPWAFGQPPAAPSLSDLKSLPAPPRLPDGPPPLPQKAAVPDPASSFPEPVRLRPPEPAKPVGRTYTVSHPAGSFVREFADGERISLRFEDDRLTAELTLREADKVSLYLEADYAMNKEGVVFGVVTAIETSAPTDRDNPDLDNPDLDGLVGLPFAFRVRQDGGTLTVRDIRFGMVMDNEMKAAVSVSVGRYTAVAGGLPAARKPVKPAFGRLSGPPVLPADASPVLPGAPFSPSRSRPVLPSWPPAAPGLIPAPDVPSVRPT